MGHPGPGATIMNLASCLALVFQSRLIEVYDGETTLALPPPGDISIAETVLALDVDPKATYLEVSGLQTHCEDSPTSSPLFITFSDGSWVMLIPEVAVVTWGYFDAGDHARMHTLTIAEAERCFPQEGTTAKPWS